MGLLNLASYGLARINILRRIMINRTKESETKIRKISRQGQKHYKCFYKIASEEKSNQRPLTEKELFASISLVFFNF